jgi:hypothetical protein
VTWLAFRRERRERGEAEMYEARSDRGHRRAMIAGDGIDPFIEPFGHTHGDSLRALFTLGQLSAGTISDEPLSEESASEERARGRGMTRDERQRERG